MRSPGPDRPNDVKLSPVEADDVADAEALLRENGLPTDDIGDPGVRLFRGVAGDRTVGVGGLEPFGEAVLLRSVAVAQDARGRGYGTAICRALEQEARRRGAQRAYLLTTDAAGFFEGIGYERCGRDDVPERVRGSRQFTDLCPSSAVCMTSALADG